jgi:O-antigen ligase
MFNQIDSCVKARTIIFWLLIICLGASAISAIESNAPWIFVGGAIFGKGISLIIGKIGTAKQNIINHVYLVLTLLLAFTASLNDRSPLFKYHEDIRWTGPWKDPNIFGLLMGAGLLLALNGLAGVIVKFSLIRKALNRVRIAKEFFFANLYLLTLILFARGLLHSYSRGAWLGTIAGVLFMAIKITGKDVVYPASLFYLQLLWLKRNRIPLLCILFSVLVLSFWQLRFSNYLPIRRLFSMADVNDFSWRNRIVMWDGALQLMLERPISGFGWGAAESVLKNKYPRLYDTSAIRTNDFLTLGISAGVIVLLCFLAYVCLMLIVKDVGRQSHVLGDYYLPLPRHFILHPIVLLFIIGFWLDGGLFLLPTGPLFWLFLELSQIQPHSNVTLESGNKEIPSPVSKGLRNVAIIIATFASLQTVANIILPCFPVNKTSLFLAKKELVSPEAIEDLDYLSQKSIWSGIPLHVFLDHGALANYNRRLVNWRLSNNIYQDYVLSPVITGQVGEQFNWRRSLWEEFYPRIRHENSPGDAAIIVVRHLGERVTIASIPNPPRDVPTIWLRQITDKFGFEILYVAALRSVGVPARLDKNGLAAFFDGVEWQPAPRPIVESFGSE